MSLVPAGVKEAQRVLQQRAENEFSIVDRLLVEHSGDGKRLASVIAQLKTDLAEKAA